MTIQLQALSQSDQNTKNVIPQPPSSDKGTSVSKEEVYIYDIVCACVCDSMQLLPIGLFECQSTISSIV